MKGALISFTPSFIGSLPNAIIFQFNPESITHGWTAATSQGGAAAAGSGAESGGCGSARPSHDPLAADSVPGETFTMKLMLNANDAIADGGSNPVAAVLAVASGVYTRLSALEMLLYPSGAFQGANLLGSVSAAIAAAGNGSAPSASVPNSQVPMVLFVWGPQRIVPVRVSQLSINETLYDSLLNPTQADVSLTLTVLTPSELQAVPGLMGKIGSVAYVYSQGLRQAQALANLGDAAASILGMLPSLF
jgi:hypothetical protein